MTEKITQDDRGLRADLDALRNDRVPVEIASWFLGGRPQNMGPFVGWDLVSTLDGFTARNLESAAGEQPKLVTAVRLGNGLNPLDRGAYRRVVDRLGPYDGLGHIADSWKRAVQLQRAVIERYPEEITSVLTGFRALVIGAESASDLPDVLADTLTGLSESVFPSSRLYFVETTERLGRRYGIARAMLNVGETPPEPRATGEVFSSSLKLMEDINIGFSAYLEPLVTSLSPHVWASTASRAGGVVILCFGKAIRSTPLFDLDLLSLSERSAQLESLPEVENVPVEAFAAALRWWVSRLDLVFSYLTEPANYVVGGRYDPPSAVERMLTFEQFCRSVQTIGSSRDQHARRLALFHGLDSLPGLNRKLTRDRATTLPSMERLLADLRQLIPADAHPVLLPRAEAAVDALRSVQDGFFMASRLQEGNLLLPNKHGTGPDVPLPLASAARDWLRVLRNSQHGMDQAPDPRERALLAAHTGELSPRIADLAWLALLEILARPELLRSHRYPSARTNA